MKTFVAGFFLAWIRHAGSGRAIRIGATVACLCLLVGQIKAAAQTSPLPFWIRYCEEPTCGGRDPLVIQITPETDQSYIPSRQSTVVPQVDGRQIDQIFFPVQLPDGFTVRYVAGSGSVMGSLVLAYSSPVIVRSDVDITVSYYNVAPVWGGTTSLNFVSSNMSSPELVTTVFRHATFLVNDEPTQLHEQGRNIVVQENEIAGINPGQMHSFFLPSEFATIGEGNFSDGNRNITINYGNPPYIASKGSVYATALPRFAHEHVHELFSEVSQKYPGNNSCLNEGLADAFAFVAGFLPEEDFGPVGVRGNTFDQGCAAIPNNFEIHDAGNCVFWQVKRMGLLTQSFAAQILHPRHVIDFDSCDLTSARTGNALIVQFSEAAGRDMTPAIQMAEIPNAGSLPAARAALGLSNSPPQVSLVKAVKPSFSDLTVASNYQLQVSSDLQNWTNEGAPFTATNSTMVYPKYWDVDNWGKLYFRLQEAP
ncbi:MAG TPA: hypothetical protein VJ063_02440 [Verrucomicrobiae bacterium]|nr:hypothetical protein [Verrucomicrobiae bacterium]